MRQFWINLFILCFCHTAWIQAAEPEVINVWPSKPPGDTKELPPETDTTKADGRQVAGKHVIRIGNVSTPQLAIYRPKPELDTGAAIVICPGGGYNILAYDLEGTEVAEWLNTIGVTGIVLKYRVPVRDPNQKWQAPVQDAQRAISLVRSKAQEWKLDPQRIGIMGFSAGGNCAGTTAILRDRQYTVIDDIDKTSCRPDFALLIYPAYFTDKGDLKLQDHLQPTKETPPMFLVHAFDDGVTPNSSLLLAAALKKVGVSAEVHVYAKGGHGYGLRPTSEAVTQWPKRAGEWLNEQGYTKKDRK
jgi:acetyl esterase/lipase